MPSAAVDRGTPGPLVPFASVRVAPVHVNTLRVAVFLAPVGLPFGLSLRFASGLVALHNRVRGAPLFRP